MEDDADTKFTQIHLADMEHGLARVLAVIALSPHKITELTGIIFDTAYEDGFSYVHAALLVTNAGKQFSLRQYYGTNNPDRTELVGSETSPDPAEDLLHFLAALGIRIESLAWYPTILSGKFKQVPFSGEGLIWDLCAIFALTPRHITEATGILFSANDSQGHPCAQIVTADERLFLLRHRPLAGARVELFTFGSNALPIATTFFLNITGISEAHLSWQATEK